MSSSNGVKVLEACRVAPSNCTAELSLPLTHYDIPFIKAPPSERLFFYEFYEGSSLGFLDSVIASLKDSLSLTLSHFLPLAGNLTWPPQSQNPIIRYAPGDSVPFTIAESNDAISFGSLSANDAIAAIHSRPLLPKLDTSDALASVIAVQATLFQGKGFCIGVTNHHAVLDGKSWMLFMKAWSFICRQTRECKDFTTLTPELTPVFDRDFIIREPSLNDEGSFDQLLEPDSRSLKLLDGVEYREDLYRATFELTQVDINNLKKKIMSWQQRKGEEALHASAFAIACAYVLICLLKASEPKGKKGFYFSFGCDLRTRLKPPLPKNYIGNCLGVGGVVKIEDEDLNEEDGVGTLAKKISDEIKEIDDRHSKGAEWWVSKLRPLYEQENQVTNLSESPKFEVYGVDFGWGKPKKVEIVSIDGNGGFALIEHRDQNGGVEAGLLLRQNEMKIFDSLFYAGLKVAL